MDGRIFAPVKTNQEVSMPRDSFVLKYFQFLKQYLAVGPPVYFVLNNTAQSLNLSQLDVQNKICGSQGCNMDSLQVSFLPVATTN